MVNDFDAFGSGVGPAKADAILIVDSNQMLPTAISFPLLKPQA
jgi:hypothetical protein